MHEVGIIESALALVERHAAEHHARRVDRVVLRVGALAGVELEALRFAFEAVAPQTVAAGATLEIEHVAAEIHCDGCGRDFTAEGSFVFTCPHCQALCGNVRRGRELELSRIEMS
jgi:hydrogenase nickel incorporation protein HypA/HybF